MSKTRKASLLAIPLVAGLLGCEPPPVEVEQYHARGVGMEGVTNVRDIPERLAANQVPESPPPAAPGMPPVTAVYQNIQVVGHLDLGSFTRLMAGVTSWVSPDAGCTYCHVGANFADDGKYTKNVARRMLQMTAEINSQWKEHVGDTGVTCYTCHRGMPVPANYWHAPADPRMARGPVGGMPGQNAPNPQIGLASLPNDVFSAYLLRDDGIRLQSKQALPSGNRASIKKAEWTYGFMMHFSTALGVNCTFCHNSRAFSPWEASTPERVRAWHGIQMVRSINNDYMEPLSAIFPENRVGPQGDTYKINCATCHQGVNKPLLGVSMLADWPSLAAPAPGPPWNLPVDEPTSDPDPEADGGAEDVEVTLESDAGAEEAAEEPSEDARRDLARSEAVEPDSVIR
ncbi:MAG: photosynthetic reaction center cytochrome PufC [Myxococcota bacterium]